MANPQSISPHGGALHLHMDDGTIFQAFQVPGNRWIVKREPSTPVDPTDPTDPTDPQPNGKFLLPFAYSTVWDYNEFHSPSRPNHDGIDFGPGLGVNGGESIRAANGGIVEFGGWGGDWFNSPGFGNVVAIDHGNVGGVNLMTIYAHMRTTPATLTGATVTKGQHLGYVGETGNAIGEHLHWETWINEVPVNPRTFMASYGE